MLSVKPPTPRSMGMSSAFSQLPANAALGFAGCAMPSYDRVLWALGSWLDSWSGIGRGAVGMHARATISS